MRRIVQGLGQPLQRSKASHPQTSTPAVSMNYPSLSETDREWAIEMVNNFRNRTGRVESANHVDRTTPKYLADSWLAGQDPCPQAANESLSADNQSTKQANLLRWSSQTAKSG